MNRYFKPTSLTWWSAVTPLCCGLLIATEPLHGLSDVVLSIKNGTGMTAPALITAGLGGIGIRGAVG